VSVDPFPITSRYHAVETADLIEPDGSKTRFLRRRFLPPTDRFETIEEHTVSEGDRIDNLSARYLGDPLQYWRICDANNAMRPEDMEQFGRRLRISLPEGITGPARG
jgi:nucleoid-associated protein YgaU